MKTLCKSGLIFAVATFLATGAVAQIGPGPFAAFPSADPTDSRFLGFGCPGIETLEQGVSIALTVPSTSSEFTLSFFDGETGGADVDGLEHWDVGDRQLEFLLYADPLLTGTTDAASLVGRWTGNDPNPLADPGGLWTTSEAQMPDNDWWGATIQTSASAQSPSGFFHYNLVIQLDGDCITGEVLESNIKVASSNPMTFLVPSFGLVAALREVVNDAAFVYPTVNFADLSNPRVFVDAPTSYDGTFTFFFSVAEGSTELR
ncbi:MAG: hypothetical protein AAF604_19040, partial [Acidobacteriota bacterium]